MDITFVLCPNILGILGLTILLIFTRFNFYLEPRKLKLFITATILNMLIISLEVADYMLSGASFQSAYLFRRVTTSLGFVLTPALPLMLYLISSPSKRKWTIWIPAGINAVMSLSSIFTGHMFYIDQWNSYYRGVLFYAMMLISCFYLFLLIGNSLNNLKYFRRSEAVFLLGIAAVIIIGNLLEILLYFHFVIWNSCAILLITYYLFLHIQYFKYDVLTNVFNRNMYSHDIQSLSHTTGIGILSFDLDGLKKVNDVRGHEAGDRYIIGAARCIERVFEKTGQVYRIGGDEFVVLMRNTTEDAIRAKIKELQKTSQESDIYISCGYSYAKTVTDASQMLRDADKAMYDNKRNRTVNR